MRLQSLQKLLITLIFLIAYNNVAAQTPEFEKWMQQENTDFQEYRDKRDKEFTSFLQTQWKEMQVFQGLERDKTPKPASIPRAPSQKIKSIPDIQQTITVKPVEIQKLPLDTEKPVEQVSVPVIRQPEQQISPLLPIDKKPNNINLSLSFYGQKLNFSVNNKLILKSQHQINNKIISSLWSQLSKANYEDLLKSLNKYRNSLALNDWCYVLLIHSFSQELMRDPDTQQIFSWFFLIKSGYQARIAYDTRHAYLLLPSMQKLYAAPYFTFDNARYYALSYDGSKVNPGRIFTYDAHYPDATRRIDMRMNKPIHTSRLPSNRKLTFTYDKVKYSINIAYDAHTINFLKTYPQMDISLYFNANFNHQTSKQILEQLKPVIKGKSELDAINIILRFVQTAFKYKTDELQFGIENYLFPEETLHYPYSDCEDRSVFFTWIVRNLTNLDVVGLDYPGHIAAAVRFTNYVEGDRVQYNGMDYVITDPTYVNAVAGMTMPAFRNAKPEIIRIGTTL